MARGPGPNPPTPEPWDQRGVTPGMATLLLAPGPTPSMHLARMASRGQLMSREQSGSVMFRALREKRSNSDGEIR